jgi:hypothetical protein
MAKRPALLEDKLRAIAARLSGRDAKAIQEAAVELEKLSEVDDDVFELQLRFARIEKWRVQEYETYPDPVNLLGTDRLAVAKCLRELVWFLERRAPSESICRLEVAFSQLAWGGSPAPLLQPVKVIKGRRPDPPQLMSVKGTLAALTACKQREGLSRKQAARWIAENISPELASRISEKNVTASMVEEWLARYGGEHPPEDPGGIAYKSWISWMDPLTNKRLRAITDHLLSGLPPRSSQSD